MSLNINKLITNINFILLFLFPTYFLNTKFGFNTSKYIFLLFILLNYIYTIGKTKKIYWAELLLIASLIIISIIKESIEPIVILETAFLYKILNILYETDNLINKKILKLSVLGVLFYSILYFGAGGRYIHTPLFATNQGGFELLILFIIIRKYNKKIGNILLLLGLLTFSRNYLLCLVIFILLDKLKNTKLYFKIYKHLSFKKLLLIIVVILILLSNIFQYAEKNNMLGQYQSGINRYVHVLDYSNYFRFTVNTNLLKIYYKNPNKLITGITDEEFYDYNYILTKEENMRYRHIKPHNYFFSYLRIYGIFAIIIFWFLSKIFNKIMDKNNFPIFVSVFVYSNILGIGFANYWLYLTVIAMIIYKEKENKNEKLDNSN